MSLITAKYVLAGYLATRPRQKALIWRNWPVLRAMCQQKTWKGIDIPHILVLEYGNFMLEKKYWKIKN